MEMALQEAINEGWNSALKKAIKVVLNHYDKEKIRGLLK